MERRPAAIRGHFEMRLAESPSNRVDLSTENRDANALGPESSGPVDIVPRRDDPS